MRFAVWNPKTRVLDSWCENLNLVQNIKTGGFHPKLEFSSCKNIDALGLPKTGVLLSQNLSFGLLMRKSDFSPKHQNWSFQPKLEFSSCENIDALGLPKTGVLLFQNLSFVKTGGFQNWSFVKTGGFHENWKFCD